MAMDPPPPPPAEGNHRSNSVSQTSESSQTAQDYIASQLSLEADAREALPYQFDTCTQPLGPLRQSVYACLTCTPPPASAFQQFTPAGLCYSCSISCHGEHDLVELFAKRDFVCDCGTTRFDNSQTPCALRVNPATGRKGGVVGEAARAANKYNHNFQGKFCGCGEEYDPEKEKGTMFQCLGLGTVDQGGCGEDWWHPECLMGLPRQHTDNPKEKNVNGLDTVKEEAEEGVERVHAQSAADTNGHNAEEATPPDGFPNEDDFEHLICYKCVNAFPWIKQYAASPGFLTAKTAKGVASADGSAVTDRTEAAVESKKRKAEEDEESQDTKRIKPDQAVEASRDPAANGHANPKHAALPAAPFGDVTLYLNEDFREHICHCPDCFPRLSQHPQLLEEEDSYEPPLSESDEDGNENGSIAGRSVNSGSLLERGEAVLSSMDRVRAIEGVMAYNHVRDKVKAFLQPFAESGQAVGAEDIKSYFAKLRGDEQTMRDASSSAGGGSGGEADHRREQDGH